MASSGLPASSVLGDAPLQGRQRVPFQSGCSHPCPAPHSRGTRKHVCLDLLFQTLLSSPPYLRAFPRTTRAARQPVSITREAGWASLLLGGLSWVRSDSAGGWGPWAPFSAEEMVSQGDAGSECGVGSTPRGPKAGSGLPDSSQACGLPSTRLSQPLLLKCVHITPKGERKRDRGALKKGSPQPHCRHLGLEHSSLGEPSRVSQDV